MTRRSRPFWRLSRRARGELGDREAAGLVDIERDRLHLARGFRDAVEVAGLDLAAADAGGGNPGLLGDDAGGELLGRHFEREEPDDAAVHRRDVPVGPHVAAPGLCDVVGEVGGERRLSHAGPARDDDQVGRLQPAHHAIEVAHAGREAGQLAVALIGVGRHLDRGGEGLGEPLEAAVIAAGLGKLIEPALGVLDLRRRPELDRGVIGDVDHHLADADERAPQREVVDRAAVVGGVDDRGRLGREPGEILARVQPADVEVGRQEGLERDRRRALAGAHQRGDVLVDLLMQRLEEMLGLEEVGDAIVRLVIDEDRAEQRLLDLDIVRRGAKKRRILRRLLASSRFDGHDGPVLSLHFLTRHAPKPADPTVCDAVTGTN